MYTGLFRNAASQTHVDHTIRFSPNETSTPFRMAARVCRRRLEPHACTHATITHARTRATITLTRVTPPGHHTVSRRCHSTAVHKCWCASLDSATVLQRLATLTHTHTHTAGSVRATNCIHASKANAAGLDTGQTTLQNKGTTYFNRAHFSTTKSSLVRVRC